MKNLLMFTALLISFNHLAKAQKTNITIPDSVGTFLSTSINIIKANSINRDSIDWNDLEKQVQTRTQTATTYNSAAEVFPYIFEYINDHHGALKIGSKSYYWKKPFTYNNTVVRNAIKQHPKLQARLLKNNIAYLCLPGNSDFSGANINADALEIRKAIDSLLQKNIKGWIVDIRLNTGGSMYQMLAGLAPLLGDGKIGSFINQHGKTDGEWWLKNGNIYLDSNQVSKLDPISQMKKLPSVVLLSSGMTASAGEVVAISFIGRPNTILIGEETAGYTTANEGFKVNDMAGLNLAVDYDADRNGYIYKDKVQPALLIPGGDNFDNLQADAKVIAAVKWLSKHKSFTLLHNIK